MEEQNEEQGLVRIGKRVYVGNLAWRTSWQDLKVNKNEWRDVEKKSDLAPRHARTTSGAAAMWSMPTS